MTKYTFAPKDFKAFDVDGLENRMEALNEHVRPQLNQLGDYFADYFSSQTGEEFYPSRSETCTSKREPTCRYLGCIRT